MTPKPRTCWLLMCALHELAEERYPGHTPCRTPYMPGLRKHGLGYYFNDCDGSTHVVFEREVAADERYKHIYAGAK